jgi:hypothetical protein
MLSRRKNAVIVAATAGALVALAGCGSSSSTAGGAPSSSNGRASSSPLQTVQSAYASTIAKKSARLALVENITLAGHHLTAKGTGVDDFAGHKLDSTITIAGQRIEVRKLGQMLYTRLPSATASRLPGSKPWLSINLATLLKDATGSSLSQLEAGQQDDPASILAYLKQASASGLHRAGTASIRGVRTTKYTATIDLNKVAAAQGGKLGSVIRSQIKTLGTSSYPMSVWVDGNGLVRQFSAHLSASPTTPSVAGSGSSSSVHVDVAATIQFFDFGTPVTVSAPPASQTNDITKVVQGLAKSPLGGVSSPAST